MTSPALRRRALRLESLEPRDVPADVSAPVILQWFDGSYQTIEKRTTPFWPGFVDGIFVG